MREAATRAGHRPGRRRGQAAVPADRGPRQARGSLRRRLPAHRLRAVESGQRPISADLRADPVQVAFAGPAHLAELAAVGACRRVHHPGPGPAAARPALVHRLRRRDLPVAEPDLRRGPRLHRGVRCRPRVPDGSRADAAVPHRERRGRDGRRHPGAARRGHARSAASTPTSPGRIREFVEKPADPPGTPDDPEQTFASMGNYIFTTKVLIDAIRADADDDDSDHDMGGDIIPRLVVDGHGRGLRLQRQRGARRHRARPRLLARRRHAGRVLRRPHGSGVGAPGVQPVQQALADPRRVGEPGAGQVRQRRLGAGVGGRRGQHHLGGLGAQFGAVVATSSSTTAPSSRAAC